MQAALILGAGLMGLAGAPHCAAMCAAPCAALTRRCGGQRPAVMAGFLAGRLLAYTAGGAVAAAGVAAVGLLGDAAPALLPLWTALQLAVLGLGLWLLCTGRQPGWWARFGRMPSTESTRPPPAGWQRVAAPLRAGAMGSLWLVLPCGLLQSALVVATLASTPLQGAAAMASFAAASSLGLWLPGALAARFMGWASPRTLDQARAASWALRLAGASLVLAAGWALGHGLWQRVAVWCGVG
jgi:sulfite exporter TauE/SafE